MDINAEYTTRIFFPSRYRHYVLEGLTNVNWFQGHRTTKSNSIDFNVIQLRIHVTLGEILLRSLVQLCVGTTRWTSTAANTIRWISTARQLLTTHHQISVRTTPSYIINPKIKQKCTYINKVETRHTLTMIEKPSL